MKTLPAASLLVLSLAGCDRVGALFGHHDSSGGSSAEPGGSATPAATGENADAPALAGFEGEIDLKATGKTSPTPMALNLLVKNDLVRADVPQDLLASPQAAGFTGGGKVYALLKASEKQLTVVMDGKRQAVVINLDGLGDRVKGMRSSMTGAPPPPAADPPKVTKTGKKDVVAGYPCEEWDVKSSDRSGARICVSDQGTSFFKLPITGIPTEQLWALELLDGKHFPLRAVASEKDGSEAGRIEVTKLDKRTVDASLFEIPAGYKQVTLDEMLQGLGGNSPQPDVPPVTPNDKPHKGHGGHHKKQH